AINAAYPHAWSITGAPDPLAPTERSMVSTTVPRVLALPTILLATSLFLCAIKVLAQTPPPAPPGVNFERVLVVGTKDAPPFAMKDDRGEWTGSASIFGSTSQSSCISVTDSRRRRSRGLSTNSGWGVGRCRYRTHRHGKARGNCRLYSAVLCHRAWDRRCE